MKELARKLTTGWKGLICLVFVCVISGCFYGQRPWYAGSTGSMSHATKTKDADASSGLDRYLRSYNLPRGWMKIMGPFSSCISLQDKISNALNRKLYGIEVWHVEKVYKIGKFLMISIPPYTKDTIPIIYASDDSGSLNGMTFNGVKETIEGSSKRNPEISESKLSQIYVSGRPALRCDFIMTEKKLKLFESTLLIEVSTNNWFCFGFSVKYDNKNRFINDWEYFVSTLQLK